MGKIMVVDDNDVITTQLEELLTLIGHEVVGKASSGEVAVEMARCVRPDLALMDIVISGELDGIDASETIREELNIPVIFLADHFDEGLTDRAKSVEPFGYIMKPFDDRELRAAIDIALSRREMEQHFREDITESKQIEVAERRRAALDRVRVSMYEMKESADISDVLAVLYDSLKDSQVDFHGCSVQIIDEGRGRFRAYGIGPGEVHLSRESSLKNSVVYEAWRDQRVIYRRDLGEEDTHGLRQISGKPVRSVLDVPFSRGTLAINSLQRDAFSKQDIKTLQEFAGVLSEMHTRFQDLRRIEESAQHWQDTFDAIGDMVSIIDRDFRIVRANRATVEAFDDEVLGAHCCELFHGAEGHPLDCPGRQVFRSGKATHYEQYEQHLGGRWLDFFCYPIKDGDGTVQQVVQVVRDITEQKLLESQLVQAQKLEAIGQLAAGIAHEINTPTQYVGDNTQFLEESFADLSGLLERYRRLLEAAKAGPVSPELIAETEDALEEADVEYLREEIPQAIAQSLEGIARVSEIVQAMREFSHPGVEEKTAVDLNRAIGSTITVARNEWKYVAEMETSFDPELPAVPCLPGELNQVVLNLLLNAVHATSDVMGDGSKGKGVIRVSTQCDGDWVEIRISDTGTGIPEEVRSRIFDPFFTTKEVGKGTGQGLAIAYNVVVEKHGGNLSFETEMGKGTTFIIRLPTKDASEQRTEDD